MENFNILVTGGVEDEDLVSDGWTDIVRNLTDPAAPRRPRDSAGELTPEEIAEFLDRCRLREDEPDPRPGGRDRRRTRRPPRR